MVNNVLIDVVGVLFQVVLLSVAKTGIVFSALGHEFKWLDCKILIVIVSEFVLRSHTGKSTDD